MEEVLVAIMGLNGEGALRLEGLPVFLYEEFCEIIRADVMTIVQEF